MRTFGVEPLNAGFDECCLAEVERWSPKCVGDTSKCPECDNLFKAVRMDIGESKAAHLVSVTGDALHIDEQAQDAERKEVLFRFDNAFFRQGHEVEYWMGQNSVSGDTPQDIYGGFLVRAQLDEDVEIDQTNTRAIRYAKGVVALVAPVGKKVEEKQLAAEPKVELAKSTDEEEDKACAGDKKKKKEKKSFDEMVVELKERRGIEV